MKRILIIEDDRSIAELQKDYLEMSGYEVTCAFDGAEGQRLIEAEQFDLVILDIMLPERDGFEILRGVADVKQMPILLVSARADEANKIKGLNLGADDYITKPFGMGELVARVNNHIKKYEKFNSGSRNSTLEAGALSVDGQDRRVFAAGEEITLTQKEFDLLLFLMQNPNRVYSKETLFERVWGYDALSDATTVTVHVARIREKIEAVARGFENIETVWGAGYRFKV